MGLRVLDFVSVGHIFAFLSSHYTFSSWARILRCQSQHLDESRIYYLPPLKVGTWIFSDAKRPNSPTRQSPHPAYGTRFSKLFTIYNKVNSAY